MPLGPQIYRLAFQPVAEASVLLLLIVAVAVHFVLVGMGLYFFGAEGGRIPAFTDGGVTLGPAYVQYQTIWIVGIAAVLIAGLALFFEHSIYGKALRATAINRTGARLMGISADLAGKLCFTLSALVVAATTPMLAGLAAMVGELVAAWERTHVPMPAAMSAAEVLRFFMAGHGLRQSDLPEIGNQSKVSEILSGKRAINLRQAKALSERFAVPLETFVD